VNGHELLRELFEDEVRELGKNLGTPHDLVMRHPFPDPGIAIQVLSSEVTLSKLPLRERSSSTRLRPLVSTTKLVRICRVAACRGC
jgi:GMP synthase PP-ATPase subunit